MIVYYILIDESKYLLINKIIVNYRRNKMIRDNTEIVKVASVYMALNIGSGFASGQEILQFFSGFGWAGYLIGLTVFILMIYGGNSMLDAGWICKDDHKISVYEYFGGKFIGRAYNVIIPILFFGSYTIMVAGAGSVLEQFFNIPNIIGRIVVVVASVLSLFLNFQHISKFIGHIGKGVALVIFIISFIVIIKGIFNITQISTFIQENPFKTPIDTFYGAAILYSGIIVLASSQFLFDVGKELNQRSSGYYGAIYGSVSFVLMALVIHTAILLYFDKVYTLPIVTIYFAELISPIVAFMTVILMFVAMYSASTITLWSVSNIIKKKFSFWRKRYIAVLCVLGGGGLVLSTIPFGKLVSLIYPINGMFGVFLIILIAYKNRRRVYETEESSDVDSTDNSEDIT